MLIVCGVLFGVCVLIFDELIFVLSGVEVEVLFGVVE